MKGSVHLKYSLGLERLLHVAGFKPETSWAEVGSANRFATRMLLEVNCYASIHIEGESTLFNYADTFCFGVIRLLDGFSSHTFGSL